MKNRNTLFATILLTLACFPILPKVQGVSSAPDGGYPGGNTAEGQDALHSLTTGTCNTAVGFDALQFNIAGNGNTAIGADALYLNNGDVNTAVGDSALRNNTADG